MQTLFILLLFLHAFFPSVPSWARPPPPCSTLHRSDFIYAPHANDVEVTKKDMCKLKRYLLTSTRHQLSRAHKNGRIVKDYFLLSLQILCAILIPL
ncbi:hypothetical protein GGU11DRAFT_325777 [Lentinula aff. detonsa]|nr:hypothetical protein GGU11DRAFT_325777 [Lentinula aff. detonsa]